MHAKYLRYLNENVSLYVILRFGAAGKAKYLRRVSHLVPIGDF